MFSNNQKGEFDNSTKKIIVRIKNGKRHITDIYRSHSIVHGHNIFVKKEYSTQSKHTRII